MSSLERVIRPFQSGDVFTARTSIPSLPATSLVISEDECVLSWTGQNPGEYDDIPSDLWLFGFQVDWKEDKSLRVTETVKIEQEDNPDNFVVVERMKETVMRNTQTGENFNLKFANWDKGRA